MKHLIYLRPAYDLRVKDCGIHGVELWVSVSDARGATAVSFFTTWHLPHVQQEFFEREGFHSYKMSAFHVEPSAACISYHSAIRVRGEKRHKSCEHLGGKPCWSDGQSFLDSHKFEQPLLAGGSKGLIEALEKEHEQHFSGKGRA